MGLVVAASVIAFLTTEMDNLVMLVVLFCANRTPAKRFAVALGCYFGLGILVAFSLAFSAILVRIHIKEILGLLGLIPIIIGIKTGIEGGKNSDERVLDKTIGIFIAFVTSVVINVSNGGDNIAVYIPFFTSLNRQEFIILCIVFFIMQAIWTIAAIVIVNAKSIKEYIQNAQTVLIPFLFILLGLYILLSSGTFIWLFGK